jgi:ketosteroid isomerase-like protein
MSHENVAKVRASLDAWNRGDVDAWLEAAHPEVEWVSQIAQSIEGSETVYRGPAEMRRFWDEWHALWDVTIEVTETIDRGDTVVALAKVHTRGEASGIALERPIAYVFEFQDGLARRARAYFDQQEALDSVGVPNPRDDKP